MNSASPHPHHHTQLVFGQLPPTTYEAAVTHAVTGAPHHPSSAPITIDTSSPPLAYNYPPQGSVVSQFSRASSGISSGNGGGGGGSGRRGPGSIKWTKEGVSTSAERRLPFVHRFRPVGLPLPTGLVSAAGSGPQPASVVAQQQHNSGLGICQIGPHIGKVLNKMSQYETNPVGALQERYQSEGVLPNYEMVQFEGMSHNPIFTFCVTIRDMKAMGSGNSKKQAKHSAARAMLDKLDGRVPPSAGLTPPDNLASQMSQNGAPVSTGGPSSAPSGPGANSNGSSSSNGSASLPSNPIGSLQEYCVKCSLPLPIYDLQTTSGQPHQRNFEILAKVGSIVSTGAGASKKDAKRAAATALLAKLRALGSDVASTAANVPVNGSSSAASGGAASDSEEVNGTSSNVKIDVLTPKHNKTLQGFYQKLQNSSKSKILALQRMSLRDPKLDCVRLLSELGDEQHFSVTYVDIDERTATGEIQCLVQLSVLPVVVCHGSGTDAAAANNKAARNALEYLKIMVRKSTKAEQPSTPPQPQLTKKTNGGGK